MANTGVIYSQNPLDGLSRRPKLAKLDEYYSNNMLYEIERVAKYYLSVWSENIRPLRTPVHRSVEFFVSKIAIGEPVISAKSAQVKEAVSQIMEWGNFQIQKPVLIREMSKYGDVFRKVVSENGKVWHELVDSDSVTDFKEDRRGFLTEIRLDVPVMDGVIQQTRTELWTTDAEVPYMAVWVHRLPEGSTIEQIQRITDPFMYSPLSAFGIDFIPFVRSAFQKDGVGWGKACFEHAVVKIDEANRQATKLHQNLFRYNKPTWVVSANQVLADGTPMPAPKLKQGTNSDKTDLEMRDNSILYLSGQSTVSSLIPNIQWKDALEILLSQEKELEKDLPELLYFSLPDNANTSGKALRQLLGAAVDRAMQAQSNFVEATVRANQMALTVGVYLGIFPAIGNFDDGSLNHSMKFHDPFPMDNEERSAALKGYVDAGLPLEFAMKKVNFSEEEIAEVAASTGVVENNGA